VIQEEIRNGAIQPWDFSPTWIGERPNVPLLQTLVLTKSVRSSGYERLLTVKGSKPLLVLHAREHAI